MSNASDDEPEIVVIAQKEVVIRTDQKQNDKHNKNKTKKNMHLRAIKK